MGNLDSKYYSFLARPVRMKRGQILFDLPVFGKFYIGNNYPADEHRTIYMPAKDITWAGDFTREAKFWQDYMKTRSNTVRKELKLFVPMIRTRREARKAKAKFADMGRIAKKYKNWHIVDLEDMKYQFISYDLNHDGLIDFPELEKALDELGDTSSHEIRRKCFDEIDIDGSNSVDFEEFLGLVEAVSRLGGGTYIEDLFKKGQENANVGRWMTVKQSRAYEIF